MTAVVVFSVVGAYSLRNSLFDVYVMVVFGLVGFALESRRVPLAPLILGLILGPMIEENLRVGLINADGSFAPFFGVGLSDADGNFAPHLTGPISAVLVTLLVIAYIVLPVLRLLRRRLSAK